MFLCLSLWLTRLVFPSHRHVGKDFKCQQYIKNARKKNIGCHMKEMYFQPSRKINLNITVRDLINNSSGLSYCKAFTPQRIGKYYLIVYYEKFIYCIISLVWKAKKGGMCDKVRILILTFYAFISLGILHKD